MLTHISHLKNSDDTNLDYTGDESIAAIAKVRFDDADWDEIERAIESRVMFNDSKIVLCSIHQFSKYY